ncbi:hypothetical protein [Ekhidna sp.]|uniref:hypothetical protein n=1 Tax=Ekhidna sp. TaxID=2608089 RepID=UPI003BAB23D4
MVRSKLSEKLDNISQHDLGFEFDDAAVWSALDQRLGSKRAYANWWIAAACFLIGFTILPIGLLKETSTYPSMITDTGAIINDLEPVVIEKKVVEIPVQSHEKRTAIVPNRVSRKGVSPALAEVASVKLLLKPIIKPVQNERNKSVFSSKDISIIQASLGRPSIEKEKKVTVRAQLHTSSQPLQFNNQSVKIKLFEGSNN